MAKIKVYGYLATTVNYDTVHYFYKLDRFDRNGNSKYRVFILDPDGIVYETLFTCYESEIEDRVISFCEGRF